MTLGARDGCCCCVGESGDAIDSVSSPPAATRDVDDKRRSRRRSVAAAAEAASWGRRLIAMLLLLMTQNKRRWENQSIDRVSAASLTPLPPGSEKEKEKGRRVFFVYCRERELQTKLKDFSLPHKKKKNHVRPRRPEVASALWRDRHEQLQCCCGGQCSRRRPGGGEERQVRESWPFR